MVGVQVVAADAHGKNIDFFSDDGSLGRRDAYPADQLCRSAPAVSSDRRQGRRYGQEDTKRTCENRRTIRFQES